MGHPVYTVQRSREMLHFWSQQILPLLHGPARVLIGKIDILFWEQPVKQSWPEPHIGEGAHTPASLFVVGSRSTSQARFIPEQQADLLEDGSVISGWGDKGFFDVRKLPDALFN